ncbi:MAG: hypothetical protein HN535_03835 [Flavobacteriales bacterium]|nr:hypothetical protein [Flavobacteriales bacterium]
MEKPAKQFVGFFYDYKLQRRIARQFLNIPGVQPRDLEDWGYVVIETHIYKNLDTAA